MSSGLGFTLTLIVWWVGTGAVFLAARGSHRRRGVSFVAASGLLVLTLTQLPALSARTDSLGVLWALVAGFLVWAWVETSFYTGYVTGPTRRTPPAGAGLWTRFRYAFAACLWHELVIPVVAGTIWLLSPGPNRWALGIFLVFWLLHEAARINVLIGVPHPFKELLPEHLSHLTPYLEARRPTWPIYATLVAHIVGLVWLVQQAVAHAGEPALLGWGALVALVGLGLIEHVVLMLPIPLERLWRSLGMGRNTPPVPSEAPPREVVPARP